MNNNIIQSNVTPTRTINTDLYQSAKALTLKTVAQSSRRVYADTFSKWETFSPDPLDLTPANVLAFLESLNLAKGSLQRMLSALRKLASVIAIAEPEFERLHTALKIINLKQIEGNGNQRKKRVLRNDEIFRAMMRYEGGDLLNVRNRAILAIAFYAGLRRSEICALKWSDIDLERGLITIVGGKGRKENNEAETVPILGEVAVEALQKWQALSAGRVYMFTNIRKGEHFAEDKPLTTEVIRRITLAAGDFRPHDARRTVITHMLESGTPVNVAQAIARHKNPQTTLRYAARKDAAELKARAKLDY